MEEGNRNLAALLVLLSAGCTGGLHNYDGASAAAAAACSETKAVAVAKRQVRKKLIVDELDFVASAIDGQYIVTGTYKAPVPGFEPTITVDAANCKVLQTRWR